MKRSDRMEKLTHVSSNIEQIAGASLNAAQAQYQKELNQLEQLKIYREDYQRLLKERLSGTVTSKEIQDYQYFFSSLDSAISQQEQTVRLREQELGEVRDNWLSKHLDTRKLSKATDTLRAGERLARDKSEQQELNEINEQLYSRNRPPIHHH